MRGRAGKVLILSPHVMTAALVGWYVELAKLEPAFAAPDEHPEEALSRETLGVIWGTGHPTVGPLTWTGTRSWRSQAATPVRCPDA